MPQLLTYNNGTGGSPTVNATANAQATTVVMRDANAGVTHVGVTGTSFGSFGGIYLGVVTYTTTATVAENIGIIKLDATAAAFTATLPAASTAAGQLFRFIKIDSTGHLPTIAASGSDTINGASTYTSLTTQYSHVTLYSDGTQWLIV